MNCKTALRHAVQFAACLLTAAAFCTGVSAAEASAGWQQDTLGRRYYYDENGEALTGEQTIDGVTYLFAPNGVQQIGWQTVDGKRCFYDPDTGEPVTGWISWRGENYYISPENGKETSDFETESGKYIADEYGVCLHDTWIESPDGWKYAGEDGVLCQGIAPVGNINCLFDENCILQTGWQTVYDTTRYFEITDETGVPALKLGWMTVDGKQYFNEETWGTIIGIWNIDGTDYCFGEDGTLQTGGWCTVEGVTCYTHSDGSVHKGLLPLRDGLYCFDQYGRVETGIVNIDGTRFYFSEDDFKAVRGTVIYDGYEYFFGDDYVMQTGSIMIDGVPCYFDSNGRRCEGFHDSEEGKYYIDPYTGERAVGWQTIDGNLYYFYEDGIMVDHTTVIDGVNCHFLENGIYKPIRICLDAGHFAKYNLSPVNPAYWESDFNWTMHLYLKEELELYGIEVITTRADKDTDMKVYDRGLCAEGCDLFRSIHSNASPNPADDGPLACCTVTGTCDQLGLDLANLVADVMGTTQRGSIWKRYSEEWEGLNYYGVLRGATFVNTPAILLEHSYHTNLRATNWLLKDENIRKLAEAEGEFLARYFGMIE